MKNKWPLIVLLSIQQISCNKTLDKENLQKTNIEIESLNKTNEESIVQKEIIIEKEALVNNDLIIKNEEFKNYVNSLGKISLPLNYVDKIGNDFPEFSKNYNKKLFKKFKATNTFFPVGIYKITKKYIAILEIDNTMLTIPVLNTYDEYGKKISSELVYDFDEPEPGFSAENNLKFEVDKIANKQIYTIYDFDEELNEPIPGTEKKNINKYTITITDTGKIKIN